MAIIINNNTSSVIFTSSYKPILICPVPKLQSCQFRNGQHPTCRLATDLDIKEALGDHLSSSRTSTCSSSKEVSEHVDPGHGTRSHVPLAAERKGRTCPEPEVRNRSSRHPCRRACNSSKKQESTLSQIVTRRAEGKECNSGWKVVTVLARQQRSCRRK